MTRINLIPVEELSDQHLIAEYRELPRVVNAVINNKIAMGNIPEFYTLGKGHVKFFYNKILFLASRYAQIFEEMCFRGFCPNPVHCAYDMLEKIKSSGYCCEKPYIFNDDEINVSRNRIIERLKKKPEWYKWTKRKRPEYLS